MTNIEKLIELGSLAVKLAPYVSDEPMDYTILADEHREMLDAIKAALPELEAMRWKQSPRATSFSIDPWGFASNVEIDGKRYEQTGNTMDGKAVYCEEGSFNQATTRFDNGMLFVLDYYKMIPAAEYKVRVAAKETRSETNQT